MEWVTPYTDDKLRELGEQGIKKLVVVPISFVQVRGSGGGSGSGSGSVTGRVQAPLNKQLLVSFVLRCPVWTSGTSRRLSGTHRGTPRVPWDSQTHGKQPGRCTTGTQGQVRGVGALVLGHFSAPPALPCSTTGVTRSWATRVATLSSVSGPGTKLDCISATSAPASNVNWKRLLPPPRAQACVPIRTESKLRGWYPEPTEKCQSWRRSINIKSEWRIVVAWRV